MTTDDEQRGRLAAKVERLEIDNVEVRGALKELKAEFQGEMKAVTRDLDGARSAVSNIRAIITAISIIAAAVWANPKQVIAALRSLFP